MRNQSTGAVALVRSGPAASAKADDAGCGDGADSPGRPVRADVERDTLALADAVEQDRAARADPATPDAAVDKTDHILTTTQKSNDDTSPLAIYQQRNAGVFLGAGKAGDGVRQGHLCTGRERVILLPKAGWGGGLRG